MHAKVAVIDDDWTTVGSSNLDPLSLFLNLEANLVVRDAPLADTLRRSVQNLMDHHCRAIQPQEARKRTLVRQILSYVAYHITRRLPSIAGWMPAHAPTRHTLPAAPITRRRRSEEHTSELQSLMRSSYAVFCLKKKTKNTIDTQHTQQ